jgi:hypothetical protein
MKPIAWTEPEPGLFRAVSYGIKFDEGAWKVYRLFEGVFYRMGIEKTLKAAQQSCSQHRRTNR